MKSKACKCDLLGTILHAGISLTAKIALCTSISISFTAVSQAQNATDISSKTKAILNFLPSISLFNKNEDGDALRAEALQQTLEQVLENQEALIKSLEDVNRSIESLKRAIGTSFSKHELHDRYVEVNRFYDSVKHITEVIAQDRNVLNSEKAYKEFSDLSENLINIASSFQSTISKIDMKKDGIALAFIAAHTANVLKQAQKDFAWLETKFSNEIPRPAIFSPDSALEKNLELFSKSLKHIIKDQMPGAHAEQDEIIKLQLGAANASLWHHVSDFLFNRPANNILPKHGVSLALASDDIAFVYNLRHLNSSRSPCNNNRTGRSNSNIRGRLSTEANDISQYIINPVFRPRLDTLNAIDIQIYHPKSTFSAKRFNVKFSTVNINSEAEANADAIFEIQIATASTGTITSVSTADCGGGGAFFSHHETSPTNFLENVSENQMFHVPVTYPNTLNHNYAENKLAAEFPIWQRNVLSHAQAKAYKAALLKLDSVFAGLVQHNENMNNIYVPILQKRKIKRQSD